MVTSRSLLASLILAGSMTLAPAAPGASAFPPEQGHLIRLAGGVYGDGLSATRASLDAPQGLAVGPDGAVYIADTGHAQVRRLLPDGTIERIAGTARGFAGDGGLATDSRLLEPRGIHVESDTLYIADSANSRVRAVDLRGGLIWTIAGDGQARFGGDDGSATAASLNRPADVAVGPDGSVYIADTGNNRVRRILPNGKITTFMGDGGSAADIDGLPAERTSVSPLAVEVDRHGDVYVGDALGCRVRVADRVTRIVRTVAGDGCGDAGDGGAATGAQLGPPVGLDVDAAGRVYIGESGIAGQTFRGRLRMVDLDGTIRTIAGGSGGCATGAGPALGPQLAGVSAVSVGASGTVFFAERGSVPGNPPCGLRVWSLGGDDIRPVAGNGTLYGGGSGDPADAINFAGIRAVTWGPEGRPFFADLRGIWSIDDSGRAVLVAGGTAGDADGPALEARFDRISGLDFDDRGRLWIADIGADKLKLLAEGEVTTMAGGTKAANYEDGPALDVRINPADVVARAGGSVVFTEAWAGSGRIRVLEEGIVTTIAGDFENRWREPVGDGGPAADALLREPWGLAEGPEGSLYVADTQHNRIRRISPSGIVTTVAGSGGAWPRGDGTVAEIASFGTPEDVTLDERGNLFVTDARTSIPSPPSPFAVRRVSPSGMVSRAAGTGSSSEGWSGPALATPLSMPLSIDAGPEGVLIGDGGTLRLLKGPAGGWPNPPRTVSCLPTFTDVEGDASYFTSLWSVPNKPWLDILQADVRTDAQNVTVTMDLLDVSELSSLPPYQEPQFANNPSNANAWYFVVQAGPDDARYAAAISPGEGGAPVSFEYGAAEGTPGYWKFAQRQGSAQGSIDAEEDRITIRVPLAALGLQTGEQVVWHEVSTGQVGVVSRLVNPVDYAGIKFGGGDEYGSGTYVPEIIVGKRCPEDY